MREPGTNQVVCPTCGHEVREIARRAVWVCEIDTARVHVAYQAGDYWAIGGIGQFRAADLPDSEAAALRAQHAETAATIRAFQTRQGLIAARLAELGETV